MRLWLYLVAMQTHFISSAPTAADLISAARRTQGMTLRDFGAALSVSHTMVANWESGISEPDRSRVAAWIVDDREWVMVLGLRMFGRQYRELIQSVLVPA